MNTIGNNRGRPIKNWNWYRWDEEQGRYIRKKRYKHPVITVIKLDPAQALLQACQIGGGYIKWTRWCYRQVTTTRNPACQRSVKGRRGWGNINFEFADPYS